MLAFGLAVNIGASVSECGGVYMTRMVLAAGTVFVAFDLRGRVTLLLCMMAYDWLLQPNGTAGRFSSSGRLASGLSSV